MQATSATYLPLPEDPAEGVVEAWGGYFIALAFLPSLLALLNFFIIYTPPQAAPEPEPIRVTLNEPPPPLAFAPPASESADEPEGAPAQAQRTVAEDAEAETDSPATESPSPPVELAAIEEAADPAEQAESDSAPSKIEFADPAPSELAIDAQPPESPRPAEDAATEPDASLPPVNPAGSGDDEAEERRLEEERELKEILDQRAALTAHNKDVSQRGSDKVGERLREASVEQSAKKWLTTTEGADRGVIRGLTTDDVPAHVAEDVFRRYGIKIAVQVLDGSTGGYSFLNQARTSSGTYHNRVGKGMYQVFSFGQVAVGRMMQLDLDEMKRRGLNPAKTRVIEVEYGIVSTKRGHDLGILKFKAAPLKAEEVETP